MHYLLWRSRTAAVVHEVLLDELEQLEGAIECGDHGYDLGDPVAVALAAVVIAAVGLVRAATRAN